jgi:tetratricopeptide (TPR) repeat protein
LQQFLQAVSGGQSSKDALQSIYHKSMAQIDADLSSYIKRRKLPVRILDCSRPVTQPAPVISDAADFDIQFALATVLASKSLSGAEGLGKLEDLSVRYPDRPEAEEEIGWLALQQNKKDEARRHFEVAVRRHSKDAEILFNTAVLEKEAGGKNAEVSALFRQALAVRPDMDNARLELGLLEYQDFQYKSALSLLSGMSAIPDDSKFEAYFTMAQCYSNLDDLTSAEIYIKKATQSARNEDQKEDAATLLETVERDKESGSTSASAIPAKVESKIINARGMTKALQCDGTQKRLTLAIDGSPDMTFDIGDPNLVVRHPSETYPRWTCGPLNPEPVTVVYATPANKAIELVF